ncbi:MAG TPA: lactonase family protein [Bryobacteraceae bacterium]
MKTTRVPALFCLFLTASFLSAAPYRAYIGGYAAGGSKGIYEFQFDTTTGKLTGGDLAVETRSPSFLIEHPNHRFIYAVNEDTNAVSAFSVDRASGKLKLINTVASRGNGPCHLALDRTGKWLAVANYGSGSVAVLPVHADGSLGEAAIFVQHQGSSANPQRQRGPHAHCVVFAPGNRYLLVADLGLDDILVYRFDPANGSITPSDPPFAKVAPGSGSRHLAFHPNGKVLYVINEIALTVTAFNWNDGRLTEFQTVPTVPKETSGGGNSTAEIAVNKKGTVLYGSNRGPNSISVFSIARDGKLTPAGVTSTEGKTPRHFALDPTGDWLIAANQNSNNLVVFRVDKKTGALKSSGASGDSPAPVCVLFTPAR